MKITIINPFSDNDLLTIDVISKQRKISSAEIAEILNLFKEHFPPKSEQLAVIFKSPTKGFAIGRVVDALVLKSEIQSDIESINNCDLKRTFLAMRKVGKYRDLFKILCKFEL